MGTTPARKRKGSWSGQREKLVSDAVTTGTSGDFVGRLEAGMPAKSCLIKVRGPGFRTPPTASVQEAGFPREGKGHGLEQCCFLWSRSVLGGSLYEQPVAITPAVED